MPQKSESVRFKNYERKIKSPLMIYEEFENVFQCQKLMGSKIQMSLIIKNIKNILLSNMVNDRFSKPFNSYLGEDAVYSFISLLNHT